MEFIVDVQGFCAQKKFIVKEIAILSRDGAQVYHNIIKPPFPWCELHAKYKSQAIWLYHNHHGLTWSDGYTNYSEFILKLPDILQKATKIFVKGDLKEEFLLTLHLTANIVNVDNQTSLKDCISIKRCLFHTEPFLCALNNVYNIKKWLDATD